MKFPHVKMTFSAWFDQLIFLLKITSNQIARERVLAEKPILMVKC
jgi:hypothetical protein